MARSLTIQRAMVPAMERAKYLANLRTKMAHYQSADCRFWVFEEVGLPGRVDGWVAKAKELTAE